MNDFIEENSSSTFLLRPFTPHDTRAVSMHSARCDRYTIAAPAPASLPSRGAEHCSVSGVSERWRSRWSQSENMK